MNQILKNLKRFWHFIWDDDSILSWVVSIVLAYIIIKFLIYPGLGLIFGTQFPIVAVVSSSMEHQGSFDDFWRTNEGFYSHFNMTEQDFMTYKFKNGFNKGDIMILVGTGDVKIGDVIVFASQRDPIIHRVIKMWVDDQGKRHFQTKGDNNPVSIKRTNLDETDIHEDYLLGKAVIRIPLLGWIKIGFVESMKLIGINIK